MDNDVNAAEALANSIGNRRAPFGTGYICGDEHFVGRTVGRRPRGSQDFDARISQPGHNSFADTLGAAGDEGPKAA